MSYIVYPNGQRSMYLGTIPAGYRIARKEKTKQGAFFFHLSPDFKTQLKQRMVDVIVKIGDWAHEYKPKPQIFE
jgi:hypothetical protein